VTNCEPDEKNLAFAARVNCVAVNEKPEEKSAGFELFKTSANVAADDVARVVVFLLSSEAKALNGQILTVDKR
jgi:NAD(P)-dependent dehydrogenase (short-subunit alcohol dehydrogenase family)